MTPPCVVLIGFGKILLTRLDELLPAGSVVVVEDPDVIRKRSVEQEVGRLACVGALLPAPYHQSLECVDAAVSHLGDRAVEAVLPGLEYGVRAAAALAARLGLPGATPAAAACLTDKLRLREAAAAGGLRSPEWTEVFGPGDVRRFARGRPVVLKPANRHASLGVQRLAAGDDVDAAWDATVQARDDVMLPDRALRWRYLAERRLDGREYSAEALVARGELLFLNVTEKLTAAGRHPVELGHVVPAGLPGAVQARFERAMGALTRAVGFRDGILHAEWMLDADGPVLIECAGRIPGDSIVDLIEAAYGCDLVGALVAVLSGRRPALPRRAKAATAIRFLTAAPGRVCAVDGVERARATPGVMRAAVTVAAGDEVAELRSSWDRVGEVIAVGRTPAEAQARAGAAVAAVRVRTSASVGAVVDGRAA